jgi:ProQ/FINO family
VSERREKKRKDREKDSLRYRLESSPNPNNPNLPLSQTGILTPREVGSALHHYVARRMYLVATAAGGDRFDLDGNPAGEVTSQQAE